MQSVTQVLQQVQQYTRLPMRDLHCKLTVGGSRCVVSVPATSLLLVDDNHCVELYGLLSVDFDPECAYMEFSLIDDSTSGEIIH